MTEPHPKRRRFPRIPSEYPVLIRKLGSEELEELSRTMSLGLGGCGFLSDEPFGTGTHVEIMISVDLRVVSAPGRIVYENHAEEGRHEIGVEFLSLGSDERRILEQLFNRDL